MAQMKYSLAIGLMISMLSTVSAGPKNSGRTLIATSGQSHVELLELFTSEGCSSCAPADQWISALKSHGDLWKSYVPVSFHVDYWNNSNWKDRLSTQAITQRQTDVASRWPEPAVYTPGVVLDGKQWTNWRAVEGPSPSEANPLKLKLDIFREADGSLTVEVAKPENIRHYKVQIAQLGMGIRTKVTGGENSGKILEHNFTVLSWEGKSLEKNQTEANFKLKSFDQKVSQTAVAAWIEEVGNPTPLQAVGGYQ